MRVQDIGEQGLLSRLHRFCPPELVGDDAAILPIAPGRSLVVTTDVLVEGVHFSLGLAHPGCITTTPEDVGWRSVAANLSDLAAMGAQPLGITVGLSLPGPIPVDWVDRLYQGMVACLLDFQTPIAGGDVCRSSVLSVAIAAFGEVIPDQAIRRDQAKPGDVLVVTGVHGASRAGLELLLHPDSGSGLSESEQQAFIRAHQRPRPRLDVLPLLTQIGALGRSPVRLAGMDSSDGLADAVVQICRASGVGAVIERQSLPMPPEFDAWLSNEQAVTWTLYGGEDFELVLCLPPAIAQALVDSLPTAQIIGYITQELGAILCDRTGMLPPTPLSLAGGFQHF